MKLRGIFTGLIALTLLTIFIFPDKSYAVPAFARQMGMACSACHFQHYPELNAFGRAFKASGYTMIGGEKTIKGDLLSIPDVLNASLLVKIRYQKTNGPDKTSGTNKGEFQIPDEAALLIGGRGGEHIGFLLEAQLPEADNATFASFKVPFVYDAYDTKFEVIPFTTDGAGASYGFELLNTGAARMQRVLEHRKEISAQQYIGTATAAEGIAFVVYRPEGHINYTAWAPYHIDGKDVSMAHYVRLALTPSVNGWDLGGGVQWWGGTSSLGSTGEVYKTHAWAVDFQGQGMINHMPLGVYITYGNAEGSNNGTNLFNSNPNDRTAFSLMGELGLLPGRATVALAYRNGDTGEKNNNQDNAFTLGATYQIALNAQLQINHTFYSGSHYNGNPANGDQLTTFMLFAAF